MDSLVLEIVVIFVVFRANEIVSFFVVFLVL